MHFHIYYFPPSSKFLCSHFTCLVIKQTLITIQSYIALLCFHIWHASLFTEQSQGEDFERYYLKALHIFFMTFAFPTSVGPFHLRSVQIVNYVMLVFPLLNTSVSLVGNSSPCSYQTVVALILAKIPSLIVTSYPSLSFR